MKGRGCNGSPVNIIVYVLVVLLFVVSHIIICAMQRGMIDAMMPCTVHNGDQAL